MGLEPEPLDLVIIIFGFIGILEVGVADLEVDITFKELGWIVDEAEKGDLKIRDGADKIPVLEEILAVLIKLQVERVYLLGDLGLKARNERGGDENQENEWT